MRGGRDSDSQTLQEKTRNLNTQSDSKTFDLVDSTAIGSERNLTSASIKQGVQLVGFDSASTKA